MGRSFGQRTLPGEQKERRTGGNTARWRDWVAPCSLRKEHEEATRQEPDPKESHRPRRRSDSHLHRKHTESLWRQAFSREDQKHPEREPGREQGLCFPRQGRRKMGAGWLQTVSSFCFELNLARQRDRDRQRQTENKRDRSRSFSSWEALRSYPHLHLSFHRIPASAPTPNELAIIPFHKYPNLSGLTKVVQLATIDLGTQNWVWIWYQSSLALKDTGSSDFGAYHWWENKTSNFSSVVGDGSSEIIKRYSTMICAACRYKQTYHTIA